MHGLVFRRSIHYWQDQPGSLGEAEGRFRKPETETDGTRLSREETLGRPLMKGAHQGQSADDEGSQLTIRAERESTLRSSPTPNPLKTL